MEDPIHEFQYAQYSNYMYDLCRKILILYFFQKFYPHELKKIGTHENKATNSITRPLIYDLLEKELQI